MNITVLGTGYVGLVSGVCLAQVGHNVLCLDLNERTVKSLNAGHPHIYEEGLDEMLKSVIQSGRFKASLVNDENIMSNDVFMIAVGTPSKEGRIDLGQIEAASKAIAQVIKKKNNRVTVLVKSTVVPGTTDTFVRNILIDQSGKAPSEFGLGMNPEFLREGNAIRDFMEPDRVVLGFEDQQTLEILESIYRPWKVDKIRCNTRTAEMIKYANNFFLALQISAANEVANLCYNIGNIDPLNVIKGVISDKRWSPIEDSQKRYVPEITTYLTPGCGFGGSCFPKDVEAIRTLQQEVGLVPRMAQAVLDVNKEQPSMVVTGLKQVLGSLKGIKVLVLGLAFKPDTDDIRESAGIKIAKELISVGAQVSCHDPVAAANIQKNEPELATILIDDWISGLEQADVIVIATKWKDYSILQSKQLTPKIREKVIFDCRRMLNAESFPESKYLSIGCNFK